MHKEIYKLHIEYAEYVEHVFDFAFTNYSFQDLFKLPRFLKMPCDPTKTKKI